MKVIGYTTADLHWMEAHGRGAWVDHPEIAGDVEFGLRQMVDLCLESEADLLLGGDNIDGPDPEPASVAALFRTLRPITNSAANIYYVIGNHDRGRDWLAPFGPRAWLVDGEVLPTRHGAIRITGLSYREPDVFRKVIAQILPVDIGIYHQSFQEWSGGGRGLPLSLLPKHRLAVCGDTHVRGAVVDGAAVRLSPGPIAPQSTVEFGPAQIWRIYDDLTIEPVTLRSRRYVRYEVDSPRSAEVVLAQLVDLRPDPELPDAVACPMVSVKMLVEIPEFIDVAKRLAADYHFALRVTDAPRTVSTNTTSAAAGVTAAAINLATAIGLSTTDERVKQLAVAATLPGADPAAVFSKDAKHHGDESTDRDFPDQPDSGGAAGGPEMALVSGGVGGL